VRRLISARWSHSSSRSDPVYHAHCRRLCAPAFRGENLRAAGHVLRHEMEDLVDRFRRDCANGDHVDVLQLFPQLTLDMYAISSITEFLYPNQCIASALVSPFSVYASIKSRLEKRTRFKRYTPCQKCGMSRVADMVFQQIQSMLIDKIVVRSSRIVDSFSSLIPAYSADTSATERCPQVADSVVAGDRHSRKHHH